MADKIITKKKPSSATPILTAYFYNDGAEIDSTGEYVKETGIPLVGETFAENVLDAGDIFCGLVTANIDQIRIIEGATEVVRFDLDTDETFSSPTDFTYPWPTAGVVFVDVVNSIDMCMGMEI